MKAKRWTLGVVLAAAVSLFGLIQADASPFSSYVLSDDLGNLVNGTAPAQGDWDEGGGDGATSGSGSGEAGGDTSDGKDNNGHGNNEDGVDSSNKGKGQGGPTGGLDESCSGTGDCVDDEISKSNGKKK